MEQRTPEEEIAYRRYLRKRIRMRKRRRKVYIVRAVTGVVALLFLALVFVGIRGIVHVVSGGGTKKEAAEKPKETPLVVDIPEGYEGIYKKLFAMRKDYDQVDDILISMSRYPKEILRLAIKNPETIDFVSDYLKHVDDDKASGEITEEEMSQVVPLFIQWDKRWGYVKYGNSIVAIDGCGPTCMSMVYTGLTEKSDMSPAEMADYCTEKDYYTTDAGTSWTLMTTGAENLGLSVEKLDLKADTVKERLKSGHPLICSMKPGDFTSEGHFIVLRGITDDEKLLVNDPNNKAHSDKEWDFDTVFDQMKALWAYSYEGAQDSGDSGENQGEASGEGQTDETDNSAAGEAERAE